VTSISFRETFKLFWDLTGKSAMLKMSSDELVNPTFKISLLTREQFVAELLPCFEISSPYSKGDATNKTSRKNAKSRSVYYIPLSIALSASVDNVICCVHVFAVSACLWVLQVWLPCTGLMFLVLIHMQQT